MGEVSYVEHEAALSFITPHANKLNIIISIHRVVDDNGLPATSLFDTIGTLDHLQSVRVSCDSALNSTILSMLARLPALQHLELCISSADFPKFSIPFHPGNFRYLEDLNCHHPTDSLIVATTFMQLTHALPLKEFIIDCDEYESSSLPIVMQLTSTLRERCQLGTLSSMYLRCWSGEIDPDLDVRSIVEPLLDFTNIRDLRLEFSLMLTSIDDDFSKRMIAAWPRLEQLVLLADNYSEAASPSRVTLEGIRALVACPRLHTLALSFDVTCNSASFAGQPISRAADLPYLRHLSVGRSIITNPFLLAATLSEIIPNLATFEWSTSTESSRDEIRAWEDFEKSYALCSKVRRQERGLPELEGIGECYGI
ncbi:hypothetical protein HWV62_27156 [Athelia sp. TMB]|nr:hypothetical protein HWV62_27156 [Athelia sp. TMB]